MSAATLARPGVRLDDRYSATAGTVMMTGVQALVRVLLDQRRADEHHGRRTAMFVSGYPGSPLAGLDRELVRARGHLDPADVVFRPGLNEELAATAVNGTQLLGELERRRVDGVTGFWFGKNPGLDRAADAIRHGNVTGTAALGGAVALVGDDPSSKSSTVPSSCEPMCRSLLVPVLAPGSVAELLELGLHAVALSRHAGLWTAVKVVADIADATATIDLPDVVGLIPTLPGRPATKPPVLLPPTNLDAELDLMEARLGRVAHYARAAGLNRVVFEPSRPRVAVVAAGVAFQALRRALLDLGLDDGACEAAGLRVVQLRMPWPLAADEVRALAAGVERVLVVEDKLPFVESAVKEALYGTAAPPLVLGRLDEHGEPLLSARSALLADDVAPAIVRVLAGAPLPEQAHRRAQVLRDRRGRSAVDPALPVRTPHFCSGCPHNASTRAAPEQLVGVGIGCHIMVALEDGNRRGRLLGMPQMGGEGAQWLGLAPFTADEHFVQNLGDGTFHHSGSLAIRAAVAAGSSITYKLLYNDAVAMTGGQRPEGRLAIPELTRWLALEGVRRVVVTTPEPERYRGVSLDPIASVRHRDALAAAEAELAALGGVTVVIHDDRCALEERRLRRRGELPTPAERVMINERVCEGCGDCGEKSSCLSVQPVDTEFGRKTRIHQASCNQDLSCLEGDCPSFLIVTPAADTGEAAALPGDGPPPVQPPPPVPKVPREVLVRMPGVGGTGVVTVSQVLQMAAHLDGRAAAGLEQIGLAQKGGPVISDLRIADAAIDGQLRAGTAQADVLLGFDLLGAASPAVLEVADAARTVAVVSTSRSPTAAMVTDTAVRFPAAGRPLAAIEAVTRADDNLVLDAQDLSTRLFADHMPANMLLVGAAFQHGCLPVSEAAIEEAIRLNGAAVARNLSAFRWGRAAACDPVAVQRALEDASGPAAATVREPPPDPRVAAVVAGCDLGESLGRLVTARGTDLVAYQGLRHARSYVEAVADVARAERRAGAAPRALPVTRAFAQHLHKLLAYKDEFEVARLHLDPAERARVEAEFGPGARVQVLLHPPVLRALGVTRKLRFGRSAVPLFRLLRSLRHLRGTRLDPFGYARVRRVERELPAEYRDLVARALEDLRPETTAQVVAIAELPDLIRGYEDIKLASVDRFRHEADRRLRELAEAAVAAGKPAGLPAAGAIRSTT